jgi:hypothetical protein
MNSQLEKSMLYYFNRNEIVRLARARLMDSIDPNIDLSPKYGDDIKVGAVIGTYGCIPQIDLQLHWLKENGIEDVLVHDDCSNEANGLKKLCDRYEVDFYTTPKNMFHKACVGSIGDQDCFYEGLRWAKRNGIDVLVKFSRRLIACYRWIDDFKKLVKESDGVTFSSYCSKDPFPIRTECFGMNVNAWTNQYTMNHLKATIENEFPTFAEYWMDAMAKQIDDQNFSGKYDAWKKSHHAGQLHSGYVHWYDLLGTCRFNDANRHKDVLWHQFSKDEDYLAKLNEVFPGKYKIEDLRNVKEI